MAEQERHILFKIKPALAGDQIADAVDVEVDRDGLSSNTAANEQETNIELERLYGIVAAIQVPTGMPTRPLNTFTGSVTITSGNINDFINRNSLYVREDDARVFFQLPAESEIGSGDYPVIFELSHFGGTQRFDSGGGAQGPDNTIRVRRPTNYDPVDLSSYLRRNSEDGANLQFSSLHRGDTAVIRKDDVSSPWVVQESSTDPRSSILPDGVFQLNSRGITFPLSVNGDHFIGGLSSYTPNQGDAFEVVGSGITEESTFGRVINTGDVLVAKEDGPSLLLTVGNDDWLRIEDAGSGDLTLREMRFLAQVGESDSFTDSRLEERSDVVDVRVFLSPFILDHAPFIAPATDPDNPQAGETGEYIGGDELDGAGYDFRADGSALALFAGEAGASIANQAFVYVDIDGGFDIQENINDVFVVVTDLDGEEVSRHNLGTEFRPITLTGSGDTYYLFDDVGALDAFSSINYHSGQTVNVVIRTTNREFNLGASFNVLPSVPNNSIPSTKLDLNAQALLHADHSLTDAQETKLDGLQTTGTATVWTAGDLFVKANDHASDDLSNYVNVNQLNGIIPDYERTRHVTFLVPNFVTVAGLQKADTPATKLAVTPIGTILGRQAFTAELPAISGANSPLDNVWQVDGMASNLSLSGAGPSFKANLNNLAQAVVDRFTPHAPEPTLPDVLQALAHDLSVTTRTGTNWQDIPAPANRAELSRQFAFGWDENRRTFGADNYFEDLVDVEFLGFGPNNIFFYSDPNDSLNTAFPGAQSYVLNDNVRARNEVGKTTISDSFNKIIGFDYSLQRALSDSDELDMLRVGPSGTVPLIGLSQEEGLYLNIGRGDGGQRTRTEVDNMTLVGSGGISYPFSTFGGVSTSGEAEFVVPNTNVQGLTFPLTATVKVRLDNNGNDEGTFEQSYIIASFGTDQAQTQFTSSHTGFASKVWNIRTEFNHDHVTFGQQDLLFIDDSASPETNPALIYYVSVEYSRTITFNVPATYARQTINAGSGHDDFGLFDPTRYNTEHVLERNRVLLLVHRASLTDVSADPELAVQVIVDGEKEGEESSGYTINLHRVASEFAFDDMSFGNVNCAVAHIQCYDHDDGHLIGEYGLLAYYNAANRWLGRFRHPTETTDTFEFSGLASFTGVIGGNNVFVEMVSDGNGGYEWAFTEI